MACGGGSSGTSFTAEEPETGSDPERIVFSSIGQFGIFNPSIANAPSDDRFWMSYSYVDPASHHPRKRSWAQKRPTRL